MSQQPCLSQSWLACASRCGRSLCRTNDMADKVCFAAPRESRSDRKVSQCSGSLATLTDCAARAAGYSGRVTLCFRHAVEGRRSTEKVCCFPFKTLPCSGRLQKAPQRILALVETGTHICVTHLRAADEDARCRQHTEYIAPRKVG